jgi:peroxiredoxin
MIGSDTFTVEGVIRLKPWGRVEGQVVGHGAPGDQVLMDGLPNSTWLEHKREYRYEGHCDAQGRFAFSRVPAGWFEVGYMVRTGEAVSSFTSRTPVVVRSGETTKVQLGGEGRPVIGRFVPPDGYSRPVYFGQGLRALVTWRPDPPRPADYDRMTKREQQDWYNQWRRTPEAQAFYEAIWRNPNWRQYAFRIDNDGTFRIEDVIAGKYTLTVYLEKEPGDPGPPEEDLGGYHGTIEVPSIPGGRGDEPLDLGDLVLRMHEPPLKAGETAPLFEAKTVDGKDVRLADYRGTFVLLSFWQPVSNPELERLKDLYKTYGGAGKLRIIGLGGNDTREEVERFVREHKIEWPEAYVGENWDSGIAKQYRNPVASYIVLVDPEGKIVATWIRGERLTKTVREAIDAAARP